MGRRICRDSRLLTVSTDRSLKDLLKIDQHNDLSQGYKGLKEFNRYSKDRNFLTGLSCKELLPEILCG